MLGFSSLDRPDFPFDGAWLEGVGLLLHIIQEDPSVPKRLQSWKVQSSPLHFADSKAIVETDDHSKAGHPAVCI